MALNHIYLFQDNQQIGPLAFDQVQKMWDAGSLNAVVPYWREGMSDWRPLEELFVSNASANTPALSPQNGPAERKLLEKMVEEQKRANAQTRGFRLGLGLLVLGIILKLVAWGLW
jgi:hypothetical protein